VGEWREAPQTATISKNRTDAPQLSLAFLQISRTTLQNRAASSLSLPGYVAAQGLCRSSNDLCIAMNDVHAYTLP